jgi:hypothetical protein
VQLTFVVEIEEEDDDEDVDVRVNPEEHSEGGWYDSDEVAGLDMTDGMRAIVAEAFAFLEGENGKPSF